jgi:LPS O-antigen subunit length determinant protein (WzzB/FepE family)
MFTFSIIIEGTKQGIVNPINWSIKFTSELSYPTSIDAENALDEYINLSRSHGFPMIGFVHTI